MWRVPITASRVLSIVALSSGCTGVVPEQDSAEEPERDSARPDSGETGSPIVWDRDQDGYTDDDDCNDYDEDVYPGAPESWNAVDDDCNGRIDADGSYMGSLSVVGTVVIEGIETNFSVPCPTEMTRSQATVDLVSVCVPEAEDAIAVLGDELRLIVEDSGLSGDTWSGRGELLSSQGWDTSLIEVTLVWREFSSTEVRAQTSSSMVSLALTASGDLLVVEENP